MNFQLSSEALRVINRHRDREAGIIKRQTRAILFEQFARRNNVGICRQLSPRKSTEGKAILPLNLAKATGNVRGDDWA